MTSIILAGGRSLRLGQNKALQVIQGKSLIQWVADRLTTLSREIIIVTAHGEAIPCSSTVRIKTVADINLGKGSLVGIYSGLVASSSARAIVVGCDMPFLSIGLLDYMTQVSSTFDVVIPRIRDKLEPLCALYSKICLAPIKELLEQNELKISRLLSTVKVKYVGKEEVDTFDPEHLSFFNVNSRDDLEKARALAAQKPELLH
jgi:molybdopterin-guanine dinucleotide biosynthesis protein A